MPGHGHGACRSRPDRASIRSIDLAPHFYDLSLGRDLGLRRKEGRFCVRCVTGAAMDALAVASGTKLADDLPHLATFLLDDSPPRVVESALGRIEVLTPIPNPGETTPTGPHTHLLPDHLETGRALPVGMDLPSAYLPVAMSYPAV